MNTILDNIPLMWGISIPIYFIGLGVLGNIVKNLENIGLATAIWFIGVFAPLWIGLIIIGLRK